MDTLNFRQKGFSLVELMVALVLSLFLIAGLFYSVLGDMKSYDSTRGTQELVTKSRMSIQYMRLYLQQAGFRDLKQLKLNLALSQRNNWSEGQVLRGFNAVSSGMATGVTNPLDNSDIVTVRFSGAAEGIFGCNGDQITSLDEHEITLYVNTDNELICDNGITEEILDNQIDNLRLLYGLSDSNSYQYFTAAEIENNKKWNAVNRVKVGLLVSQQVQANHLNNSQIYQLFDRDISAANDTNYKKVITETVLIRNKGD